MAETLVPTDVSVLCEQGVVAETLVPTDVSVLCVRRVSWLRPLY